MLRQTIFKQTRLLFKKESRNAMEKINSSLDTDLPESQKALITEPPEVIFFFFFFSSNLFYSNQKLLHLQQEQKEDFYSTTKKFEKIEFLFSFLTLFRFHLL